MTQFARTLSALMLSLAIVAPASAASPIEAAFGNTIVSTYPSGRSTKLWLKRDGSYVGQRTNGKRTSGRWMLKGGELCLRQTGPVAIPLRFCSPIPKVKVGASWRGKSPKGEPLRNRLVRGRV